MTDLGELAGRCETATGPDRELDAEIAVAVDFMFENWSARTLLETGNSLADMAKHWPRLPRYSASLDAAMTLVPEGWGRHVGNCGPKSCPYACVTRPREPFTDFTADAATEALALCAAALRSRSAGE